MDDEINVILSYLQTTRGIDFTCQRLIKEKNTIKNRLLQNRISDARTYIKFLENHPEEFAFLIDMMTVNVSRFFRNSYTFETLAKRVFPALTLQKTKQPSPELRIWSVGCASGEEPYSVALLIHELLSKECLKMDIHIFATDINQSILNKAQAGTFTKEQLQNVKLGLLNRYFTQDGDKYRLDQKIIDMVSFSYHDVIDPKTYVPPECVFGSFDVVLCRNLSIYFQEERQKIVINKLYRSLAPQGYLVLGEAERLPQEFKYQFDHDLNYCHIYRRIN